jgi:hypothetical protein
MARTFFSALGVLFMALALFAASFLGNVAADIDNRRGDYASVAVDVVREVSRAEKRAVVEMHFAEGAREDGLTSLGADLHDLKLLGPLLHADDVKVEVRWLRPLGGYFASPGVLADRLAALVNRTVRVTFTGNFAGGLADVTAELRREGGSIKLWRLRIESRQKERLEQPSERRVISHA